MIRPAPVGLLALSAIPLTAGALRLVQLGGGPDTIPPDDRFTGLPVALVAHILGATAYVVLGAFQFVPGFRRRHPAWHRRTGRLLVLAGMVVAVSALWMTVGYAPKPGTGALLFVLRLIFGLAMAVSLVVAVRAARARDLATHRAWMVRAYAIALAAGTQAFTEGLGVAAFGTGEIRGDLAKGAGWVINLVVAEWIIRRPARTRREHRTPRDPHPPWRQNTLPHAPRGVTHVHDNPGTVRHIG